MESNGKRVTRGRRPHLPVRPARSSGASRAPTRNTHSSNSCTRAPTSSPVDFIAAARPRDADTEHHGLLLANCLAQGAALAFGSTEAEARTGSAAAEADHIAPHRTFPGDRPSTTILYRQLDPFALGRLIALYEHKVFTMGAIWDINSFDQFGVELGKALALRLAPVMRGEEGADAGLDQSTAGLVARIRELAG